MSSSSPFETEEKETHTEHSFRSSSLINDGSDPLSNAPTSQQGQSKPFRVQVGEPQLLSRELSYGGEHFSIVGADNNNLSGKGPRRSPSHHGSTRPQTSWIHENHDEFLAVGQLGTESGTQTPFADESDVDSAGPAPRVTFVTPVVPRDSSSAGKVMGMKKRAMRTRPATAPQNSTAGNEAQQSSVAFGGIESELAFPEVPYRPEPTESARKAGQGRRRATSKADVPDIELQMMSFSNRALPPLPTQQQPDTKVVEPVRPIDEIRARLASMPITNIDTPPLSVLDEFEWHASPGPQAGPGATLTPTVPGSTGLSRTTSRPSREPSQAGSIRSVGSKVPMTPSSEASEPSPFAYSPPSISSERYEALGKYALQSRENLSSCGTPSTISLDLDMADPREILRRVKTARIPCGLEEELAESDIGSPQSSLAGQVLAEDLPPLMSTYYMKGRDFADLPRHELDRIERRAERLLAARNAKMASEKARSKGLKAAEPKPESYRPVKILEEEAKFLGDDRSKSSKTKSVVKKKSTLSKVTSRQTPSQLDYLPATYIDDYNGRSNDSSSTHDTASLSSSMLGDTRSRFSVNSSSDMSLGSAHKNSYSRKGSETSAPDSARQGLGRLFGKKKASKASY